MTVDPSPKSPNTNTRKKEDWKAKAEEYLANLKRAQADLINFRRRSEEEKEAFIKYAHSDLMLQILPVLDNFKRAALHTPLTDGNDQLKNWIAGIQSIEKQLEMLLQNNGITEIPVQPGDLFNPVHHDALASAESDQPVDTVLEVVETGYMLHGKLLRPAKVKVSRGQ